MLPLKGIIFLTLNVIRLLSLLALTFTFTTAIMLMVRDSNAYSKLRSEDELSKAMSEYEYLPESNIPTTSWGMFWTELNRFWVLLVCIVLCMSELSVGLLNVILSATIPILGPAFSTAPLGVVQAILASSLLSHYNFGFPLFAPWMLFFVGMLNVVAGVIFGKRGKMRRSMFRSKRDALEQAKAGDAVPLGTAMRSLARTGLAEIGKLKVKRRSRAAKGKTSEKDHLLPTAHVVRPIRTAMDAFYGHSTYGVGVPRDTHAHDHSRQGDVHLTRLHAQHPPGRTHDEILRWRARQENIEAEKRQEEQERGGARNVKTSYSSKPVSSHLINHYAWNAQHDIVVPRRTPSAEETLSALIHELGVEQTYAVPSSSSTTQHAAEPTSKRKSFRRRTLVLSKMVANVKRGSTSAASAAKQAATRTRKAAATAARASTCRSRLPRMPGAYRQTSDRVGAKSGGVGLRTNEQPSVWAPIDENYRTTKHLQPPPLSYQPPRDRVDDVEEYDDGRSRYESLPVADRFASV